MGRGERENTFEEFAEGLNELESHVFKEATNVLIFLLADSLGWGKEDTYVVGLDSSTRTLEGDTLNDIWI